ncbi:MAG: GIY-YIG nuclease family protein [Deltaproteobacteria bacterium]|nr:GIY-YIG nuclease family protein [Deltaproteobacteria bacterium]
MTWSVYMIMASDRSLYTGITTDVTRRWDEHVSGRGGAKYFRGRAPEKIVYIEPGHTRSSAARREAEIKKLRAAEKWQLVKTQKD